MKGNYMLRYLGFVLSVFLLITSAVEARPISYPGGWTGMFQNDGDVNSAHIHYSPTAKMSVGYKSEYWRDDEFTINAVQMNNLIKRWNKKNSQANFYLRSGLGVASSMQGNFTDKNEPAAFTGIATDWEDRRLFISYANRYTQAGDIHDGFHQSARVGVTPYIGDYGDLHTWMMLEVQHDPEGDDTYTVTPLLRFFKGVNLIETGISNHGDVMFNWVIRY
jgi:hypothetical protein